VDVVEEVVILELPKSCLVLGGDEVAWEGGREGGREGRQDHEEVCVKNEKKEEGERSGGRGEGGKEGLTEEEIHGVLLGLVGEGVGVVATDGG